ncbi:MAG TPA: thioredoxin domain-containing protein [Terriglobia bacterium]|nr:thioredoxin domain-containing protein [Terriglobia bacterium]
MRRATLFALSLLGLFDSLYLLWVYTSPSRPLVCLGTGCDVVRATAYAHLAGHPLPVYGVALYAALAILVFAESLTLSSQLARLERLAVVLLAGGGFLFSVYLTGLEAFVINAWCAWCVASAIIVTLMFVLALIDFTRPQSQADAPSALAGTRWQFALLVLGVALGVPAFLRLAGTPEIAPPPPVSQDVMEQRLVRPDSHATGDLQSPVTVVEFGDFECPLCGLAQKTVQQMLNRYGNRVRFVFRQFPVSEIHPYAEAAAVASECAAEQGRFWPSEEMLYQNQRDLSGPALERYAAELGLDKAQFDQCLSDPATATRVKRDHDDGEAVGVRATPTFFVGRQMIVGPPPFEELAQLLDRDLAQHAGIEPGPARHPETGTAASPPEKATSSPVTGGAGDAPSAAGSTGFGSPSGLTQLGSSALACNPDQEKQQQPTVIHTVDAQQLFGTPPKPLFVDVSEPADFAKEHIPGALNVPVEEIEKRWNSLPQDKTIVLYESGRSGSSPDDVCAFSRAAGRVLLSHGFSHDRVKVYQEGLAGWQKAGLPVEKQ